MKLLATILAESSPTVKLRDAELLGFTLTPDPERLDERTLLESCFAPPGRYVGEMLQRARRAFPSQRRLLAFNPYLTPSARTVELIVERAGRDDELGVAYADKRGRPIAYAVAASVVDDCPPVHLALLTCQSAALDERLLGASFGESRVVACPIPASWVAEGANGYWPLSPAMVPAATRACELLESLPSSSARRDALGEGARAAVVGYHGGDVLFWLQALALEPTRFDALVVLEDFADIVRYLRPDLQCLSVQQRVPWRNGYEPRDEQAVLWEMVTELERRGLGGRRFWHLSRPFRDYRRARHHLRESMAFALGGRGHGLRQPPASPVARDDQRRTRPLRGRVVVHFEGGWPLKEYPVEQRGELLDSLGRAGYEPVILGRAEPAAPTVPAVSYGNLAAFRALLVAAEAMIGCDSFPAHFSQALELPTVQLFGSTRPSNSCGVESSSYRLLHRALPCVPCVDQRVCHVDGGNRCHAHATPADVLAALRSMLKPERAAPPPLRDDELDVPPLVFASRPPLGDAKRDQFLDGLFSMVKLERVASCPLCGATDPSPVGTRYRLPVVACRSCGLWYVEQRIRAADLPRLYSELYWTELMRLHGYPQHVERYVFDYMAALERVRDLAPHVRAGGAVLEIGCALGALVRRWRETGRHAVGLELDEAVARRARFYSGVPVYTSLDDVKEREPTFDAVVMYDVFEHLYDPVRELERLRPLMARDAVLLLETFRTDSEAFARDGIQHEDVKPIEHPFMYRQSHIEELLRRAGLEPFRITYPCGETNARIRVAARWSG